MYEDLAPLEEEPVSVHAPYVVYPDGEYRYANAAERYAALLEALDGVPLGAYDQRFLHWLTGLQTHVSAAVVSLLWHPPCRPAGVPGRGEFRWALM